jgi:NAD(P)H-dependent FMN reductase
MSEMGQLAVIIASVRKDRVGPMVARWFLSRVQANTFPAVDVIDLADLDLPDDLGGGGDTEIFAKRIERADAIVVVTPEYNRGYPGALKTAIDSVLPEWRAKPIGFVSYGGISGGLRAVEQLRMIFAELHVVTVQASVSLPHVWVSSTSTATSANRNARGRRRTPCYDRLPGGAGRSARPKPSGPTTADQRTTP